MNGVVFEVVHGQTWGVPIDKNYGEIFSPGRMGISTDQEKHGRWNPSEQVEPAELQMVASVAGLKA